MNADTHATFPGPHLELIAASETAVRAIPPLWPLSATVAVNPYLGQVHKTLPEVAALMGRISDAPVTMPADWYAARLASGEIAEADIAEAASRAPAGTPADGAALLSAARTPAAAPLPGIAELAARVSGIDWPAIVEQRIGAWAAGQFDTGQALWQLTPGHGSWSGWQVYASRDLTPEIAGLTGFAAHVAAAPDRARVALAQACDTLGLTAAAAPGYFHQLLLDMGGWAQVARQHLWQAELAGETDQTASDLLAIRLVWDQALFLQYRDRIGAAWAEVLAAHARPVSPSAAQIALCVLQEAAEIAHQRTLTDTLAQPVTAKAPARPRMQAAFCIDVRSEVFRRALEGVDPGIDTLGFAGFFGLAVAHRDLASDTVEDRLPVLLTAGVASAATTDANAAMDRAVRLSARARRAWGRFKLAAVSSFAFVEAAGPLYGAKLVRDALGLAPAAPAPAPVPRLDASVDLAAQIGAAGAILRAMSLREGFAPLVLLVGHGANVVNNPHASALHCGACGGYSGEVNARLLAGLLNEPAVRKGVAEGGIAIPDDTVFVAGLHDTTTDALTLYADDLAQAPDLSQARAWLAEAGRIARTERALRLPRADSGAAIAARAADWAETRPEWALAGCSAFIAAPRAVTRGKALNGQAFLHDYDWRQDDGFGVLELILTAPVVVASWISLQYYGSVVAPRLFGAGNKVLHNVTGGLGVVEGNGGNLRGGLPWQSVHDGAALAHTPLRLSVCVAAPAQAIGDILARHPDVQALFDNRWLHLFRLDDAGRIAQRYEGRLAWSAAPEAAARAA